MLAAAARCWPAAPPDTSCEDPAFLAYPLTLGLKHSLFNFIDKWFKFQVIYDLLKLHFVNLSRVAVSLDAERGRAVGDSNYSREDLAERC